MARWRTLAYELFDLAPGSFSGSWGIVHACKHAYDIVAQHHDYPKIQKAFKYAEWVATHDGERFQSAIDIEFFLPIMGAERTRAIAKQLLPDQLFIDKYALWVREGKPPARNR